MVQHTHRSSRWFAALVVATLLGAACSSGKATSGSTSATVAPASAATAAPPADTAVPGTPPPTATPAQVAAIQEALAGTPAGCDALDSRHCLLPFPSNAFTMEDPSSDTGLRVNLPAESGLANTNGVAVDMTEWNRNDGFSPNSTLLAYVPGLDAQASQLPSWTDLDASLAADSPVVIVDADTAERVPLWAEPDVKATTDDERLLVIHPAVVLTEGHRYVVALRSLKSADGAPIEPGPVFQALRDEFDIADLADRRESMQRTLGDLADAGVARDDMFLAWDFTVASQRNISERMLSIRDQALSELGDAAPPLTVTAVTPNPEDLIALRIEGTYTVPNFLTGDGGAGNGFNYGPAKPTADALPQPNGTVEVSFACNVSNSTMNGSEPAHLVQYGHGLLGSFDEINAGNVRAFADEHNVVVCATKWAGMSEDDIANAATTLGEVSNFDTVADRLQQGVLNQIFLGRMMIRDGGLNTVPELKRADGSLMIDTTHLDYDGNSQGGIMGIMLAAVSPDIERAVVGVPGINYSLLLPRSVDFADYEAFFDPAYPSELDRMIILDLLQMLWDRGEGAGYVSHLTKDPYANTPAKTVLFDVAFGDWQVTELSAMIAARATGATIHQPVTAAGRSREQTPGWGLEPTVYPGTGSGIIIWDSGSEPIPVDGVPPSTGRDPHEDPRADADVRAQKATFLFEDTLVDACNGAPCTADQRD